jgi:hypothetical protein
MKVLSLEEGTFFIMGEYLPSASIELIKYYLTAFFDFVILYECYYTYNWNYYLICPCYGNNLKALDIKEIFA